MTGLVLIALVLLLIAGGAIAHGRSQSGQADALYRRLCAAEDRAEANYDYGTDQAQQLAFAQRRLDGMKRHKDRLLEERSDLARENAGLQAQNAQLRDAFEVLSKATNGELRTHLERAHFYGLLPSEFFLPAQRNGEISD